MQTTTMTIDRRPAPLDVRFPRKLGVPARDLDDASLERALRNLWRTRQEVVVNGSGHAIRTHTDRMLELEHEYVARFPWLSVASPARTRRGARERSVHGSDGGASHPRDRLEARHV